MEEPLNLVATFLEHVPVRLAMPNHEALRSGHSVLFTTASQLLLDLGSRDSSRSLESRLRHYARVGLRIIDELGYPLLRRAQRRPALPTRQLAL